MVEMKINQVEHSVLKYAVTEKWWRQQYRTAAEFCCKGIEALSFCASFRVDHGIWQFRAS